MVNPLDETTELLRERQTTHGSFFDHSRITQNLKDVMHDEPGWGALNQMQRESLEMIQHKIGRILAGNPNEHDHWNDIAGYAKLPVVFEVLDADPPL